MTACLADEFVLHFMKLNPEVKPLCKLVHDQFTVYLLAGNLNRMKALKAQEIERTKEFGTRVNRWLAAATIEPVAPVAGTNQDTEMQDA